MQLELQDLTKFASVHAAIQNIDTRGCKIGEVVTLDESFEHESSRNQHQQQHQNGPARKKAKLDEKVLFQELSDMLCDLRLTALDFTAQGEIKQPKNKITPLYVTKNGEKIKAGSIFNPDVKMLIEASTPAPYGDLKTQQTVINEDVRRALECKDFIVGNDPENKSFDIGLVIEQITEFMKEEIHLQQEKINIYTEGGFFKAHVDTPTNTRTMIGSLVVCLPCTHTGGDLVIKHNGNKKVFKTDRKTKNVTWIAFFSDCLHQVKPVTSGTRITITYSIHKNEASNYDMNVTREEMQLRPIRDKVRSIKTRPFGIFLDHTYTGHAIESGILKGDDKILFQSLQRIESDKLTILPVMYKQYRTWDEDEDAGESSKIVYSMTKEDLNRLMSGKYPLKSEYGTNVPFVVAKNTGVQLSEEESEGHYTGNYSEPSEFTAIYFHAAIIVNKSGRGQMFSTNRYSTLKFDDLNIVAFGPPAQERQRQPVKKTEVQDVIVID